VDAKALTARTNDLVSRGETAAAADLVAEHWRAWVRDGAVAEGLETTAALLAAGESNDPRGVRVLYADGLLAFRAGDDDRSRASNDEALALARRIGDLPGECLAMTGLSRLALRSGNYSEVVEMAGQACTLADSSGDRGARAAPLHLLAAGTRLGGDFARAKDLYIESLELNRELDNSGGVEMEVHNLGWLELHLGNVAEAERLFGELEKHPSADEYMAAWRGLNRAALAAMRGERERAVQMFEDATKAIGALGVEPDPDDQFELDWLRQIING
jgi:tetratricopeptide (TPR) repeat protein